MLEECLSQIEKKFTLTPIDSSEFDGIKVSGLKFDIKAYDAKRLGHVSTMAAKGFFGLMKMDTLIIIPRELDLPLFSYDRIKAAGKEIILIEFYDTLLEPCDLGSIDKIKADNSSFDKYEMEKRWYDEITLPQTMTFKGKKKDSREFDKLYRECLNAFLELPARQVTDVDAKIAKSSKYCEGLLKFGGTSTDVFMKNLGREKTERLFREILFKS